MSDDLVKRICQQWIDAGYADECFSEVWPGDPEPEDSLTPRMVFDCIEALEAKLAKAVEALRFYGGVMPVSFSPGQDGGTKARDSIAELKGETDG